MSIRRNLDRRTLEEEHSRHFIKTTDFPTAHSVILRSEPSPEAPVSSCTIQPPVWLVARRKIVKARVLDQCRSAAGRSQATFAKVSMS